MSQSNRKRFKLASVIDRLHVENAISSKKSNRGSCDQAGNRKFVNPLLLRQRRKHVEELITVIPNGADKTKGHIYKRLQSKPSEGGTVICELCGRRSFKSYSKTLQVAEDGGPLKVVTKRVCRQCHDVDGGPAKLKHRNKSRTRPYYESPLIGLTAERASKSWYFIRRDYVCKKQDKLHKNQCNENEYQHEYISDASSRESDTSECESDEEDTDYQSDDEINLAKECQTSIKCLSKECGTSIKCLSAREDEDIPEIHRQRHSYINDLKNDQGYQDHLALRNEHHSDSDKSLSPEEDDVKPPKMFIKRPNEIGRIGHLLEDRNTSSKSINLALAVSQDKEVSNVPLAIDVDLSPSDHTYFTRPSYDINIEDKSVLRDSLLCTDNTMKHLQSTSISSEDSYVEIECLGDNIARNLLKDIGNDLEIKCLDLDENYLLNHFLTPCMRSNVILDDDLHDSFESKPARFRVIKNVFNKNTKEINIKNRKDNPKPSYHKGVCRLVTVVNRKRSHYKDGSYNSCFYDSRGIYCKKQDLPSFIQLDDRKLKNQKQTSKRKEIDDLLLKYSPASPIPPGPVKVISCGLDDANLTLKELKEKFWPRSNSASNEKGNYEKGLPGYVCGVCRQSVKSYSSYNRNNAPTKFLQYFKDTENRIRICRTCLLTPNCGIRTSGSSGVSGACGVSGAGTSGGLGKNRPIVTKKRKFDQIDNEGTRKFRRFSRFVDTPIEVISPKVKRPCQRNIAPTPSLLPKPKIVVDSIPAGTISLNDEIGKILIRNSSPQSPLGISSFGRLNLKVVQNPNESQIKNIAQNCKTKYVIVQTAPTSGESKVQKLSTDKTSGKILCGETKLGNHGDITINGQKYKIDTEFKLNDLVKDNENAFLSAETQKDILTRLPSILKRSPSSKDGAPAQFKIVNVVESSSALSGTCISSAKSLSSNTQKFILQSIAPAPRKDGSQVSTSMFSSTTPTILPKISSHVKGSSFPVADYTVVTPKKLQCIAPKTSISSSSFVTAFSTGGHSNTTSQVDTSVYSNVSTANLLGGKRNTVILHVAKPETVIADTITNGGNCLETDSLNVKPFTMKQPAAMSPPALKEISTTEIKIADNNTQCRGTNLMEMRVPENIVHRPARKIIVNPPVVPVTCVSCQSSTPYVISTLTSSFTSSLTPYVDILVDIPSTDLVSDVKSSVITNCSTGSSPMKSLYGLKSVGVPSSDLQNSTGTNCIINSTSCKPTSNLNTLIATNSIPQLSIMVTRIDIPSTTTTTTKIKTCTTSSHLVISASSYKPWMSTSTAISSSLVKSINELRASLTTSITTTNRTTPFIVRSANNSIDNSSACNSIGKHLKTTTSMTASNKAAPISLNDYSSVTIRGNLVPLAKFGSNLNSSSTKTCDVIPPKSHVVKFPTSNIISTIPTSLKTSSNSRNGDSKDMKAISSNILDLNNGIKIVGTYVKSEAITPHFSITPIPSTASSQTIPSIASYNDFNNGELKICK